MISEEKNISHFDEQTVFSLYNTDTFSWFNLVLWLF